MDEKPAEDYANTLNLIPQILGMGILWGSPMLQFWGAASGPLKPYYYPNVDTSPSLDGFLFWFALCFLPCLLPESYFRPKAFEIKGRLYEVLGVRFFLRFAPNGDLIQRLVRRKYPGYRIVKGRQSLARRWKETCSGEKGHLVFGLMGLFSCVYAWRIGWHGWAMVMMLGNVVANGYPVGLQRYVRSRLHRIGLKAVSSPETDR
jgi:hypothetical protein